MADYYSLLSRAVAALPQSAPESRQAVYERARKALFKQLRGIQPPVAEEDIDSEGRALDEAIARVELEAVRAAAAGAERKEPAVAPAPTPTSEPTPAVEQPLREAEPAREEGSAPATPQRPAAPLPSLPEPTSNTRRVLVIAGVLAAVVALVALLALQFRERPEDLARLTLGPQTGEEPAEGGKLADRVGGGEPAAPVESSKPTDQTQKAQPVAVAQKAELWVAAPEEASKVKTFSGTVIWRLESVPTGAGQALTPAIRGDIDIPGAQLKAALVIQKNLDPALSASHTINVSFQFAPGGEFKGVKTIAALQMRRPEAQSGEQVAGVLVPITANNFLIGLLPGNPEARNLTLLRAPLIIDLPMQLENGRAATIALEKGPAGERVFLDALDAWAQK
ncbi:hypothetical protein [Methylosinus sp. Sm6]|uniref:hypothetical protein n=1 Tax=Methylosinus sp. Sm6 TaxID=2866948 RepID=UPI001C98F9E4|nr:hypothetical protein [Methylosinus sp. Sm6]MBY6243159.1 hypothetical protein [Methylosinus sp. Sm6]